jgi:hypothetical protein
MAQEINFYQGDTFIVDGTYTDAADNPIDITAGGITVESYIRDRNNLKIDLNVEILPEIGQYRIESPTDTWPLGRILWFVRYIDANNVKKSAEPVVINVEVA